MGQSLLIYVSVALIIVKHHQVIMVTFDSLIWDADGVTFHVNTDMP